MMQPVVKPVVKPFDNRFDNRLYRVNGVILSSRITSAVAMTGLLLAWSGVPVLSVASCYMHRWTSLRMHVNAAYRI